MGVRLTNNMRIDIFAHIVPQGCLDALIKRKMASHAFPLCDVVVVALLLAFSGIALWLPSLTC